MLRIEVIILGLIMILLIALIWLCPTLEQFRRQRIKEQAFPSPWETIIQKNLPIYKHFAPLLQKRLQGHIQVMVAEKQFVGCGGLSITEDSNSNP